MTQPLFDPEHWHAFLKKLGGEPAIPILIGIWPLNSYKQALRLNNEVPGIVIPASLLKSMESPARLPAIEVLQWPARCSPGPAPNWPARTSFRRSSGTKKFWRFVEAEPTGRKRLSASAEFIHELYLQEPLPTVLPRPRSCDRE